MTVGEEGRGGQRSRDDARRLLGTGHLLPAVWKQSDTIFLFFLPILNESFSLCFGEMTGCSSLAEV